MRITCKLVLLCAAAAAAMALSASSAAAETPIEVSQEGGAHCDPCTALAPGELVFRSLGTLLFRCEDTFEMSVGEDGTGSLTYTNEPHHTTVGPGCTRTPCNGVGEPVAEHPFSIQSTEEIAPQQGEMPVRFCFPRA